MPLFSPGVSVTVTDYSTFIPHSKTWQEVLRGLYLMNIMDRTEENTKYVTEIMQQQYPGPYIVESYYNKNLNGFDYRLRFEDPKEQTLWLLKYS